MGLLAISLFYIFRFYRRLLNTYILYYILVFVCTCFQPRASFVFARPIQNSWHNCANWTQQNLTSQLYSIIYLYRIGHELMWCGEFARVVWPRECEILANAFYASARARSFRRNMPPASAGMRYVPFLY